MYVQKNKAGQVIGVFSEKQPGIAEVWVDGAQIEQAAKTYDQVAQDRLNAYSNRFTGSDRLKIEADAELASGNAEKAKKAEEAWLARRAEIAAQNPWPVEAKRK